MYTKKIKSVFISLFSLEYYIGVLKGQRSFHIFLFTFLLSILLTTQVSISLIKDIYPLASNIETRSIKFIETYYPKGFELKIKNGKASTNVNEPYFITLPKEIIEKPETFEKKHDSLSKVRILAIDTKGKAEDFESYQSMALLTQNSFVYFNDGNINIKSLREVDDLVINENKIVTQIQKYSKKFHIQELIIGVLFLLPIFIFVGNFLAILFNFLILSIGVYIILRINELKFPYSKIILFTSAIAFLPTIIWKLIELLPSKTIPISYLGFIVDILVLGISYLAIKKIIFTNKNLLNQKSVEQKTEEYYSNKHMDSNKKDTENHNKE